jgi:hypothetical protein
MAQGERSVLTGPVRIVTLATAAGEMPEIGISAETAAVASRASATAAVEIVSVTATSAAIREAGRVHSEERNRAREATLRATEDSPALVRAVLEEVRGDRAPVLEAEVADPAGAAVVAVAGDGNYLRRGEQPG